jgi:hypothetical protein
MMSAIPDLLFTVTRTTPSLLIFTVMVAGMVICFRRWHLGPGARLAGIGFAIAALNSLGSTLVSYVIPMRTSFNDPEGNILFHVYITLPTLVALVAFSLIVAGLRSTLQELSHFRHGVLRDAEEL